MIRNARLDINAAFVRWVAEHLKVDRKEAIRQIMEAFMDRANCAYEEFDMWAIDDDGDLYVGEASWPLQWPGGNGESVRWLR